VDPTELARRLLEPIPANKSFGLRITHANNGEAEVVIDAPPHLANVIGSLHSSGLIALSDAAGLAAIIATARDEKEFDGVIPLGAAAELQFLAPARGRLVARCNLTESDVATVRALLDGETDKISLRTAVDVANAAGAVVCTGGFRWSVRRATS
jgi:acyl-coenzyme A thioesterase PaaI-like protein